MNPETERLMKLADAYYDYFARQSGKAQHDLQAAIESLVADRDKQWIEAIAPGNVETEFGKQCGTPEKYAKFAKATAECDAENAAFVRQLVSDRDTLAAGVLSPDDDAITKAIGVAERITAASEPAKPAEQHAATATGEAKPEPTDLRTLVEGMNHCIDAAIGSLIGAARDKNLLTIDALRAIARVVEELAKEANP